MQKRFFHPVVIFILAQLTWLSLLGLWIYWYISNYIIFNQVGDRLSPQVVSEGRNVIALVIGLVLLVTLLAGFYMIYIFLTRQLSLNRLYDNFIANVTHELKSPLASIQMCIETMKYREVPQKIQHEFIELMLRDTNRLNNLINSILKLSALEQKRIAHNFQIYSAKTLTEVLLSESTEQFKLTDKNYTLSGSDDCKLVIDRNAMKIVFDNIIDNAIKYSPQKLKLNVKYFIFGRNFVIEFTDQGVGINPKDFKKVFSKFLRLHNEKSPNVKGTGLGLYWVREIVRYHGGHVSATSEGLNQGTTIRIEIPIYQTAKRRYINYLLRISHNEKRSIKLKEDL